MSGIGKAPLIIVLLDESRVGCLLRDLYTTVEKVPPPGSIISFDIKRTRGPTQGFDSSTSEASPLEQIYKLEPYVNEETGEEEEQPFFKSPELMQGTLIKDGKVFALNPKKIAGKITEQRYLKMLGGQSEEEVRLARKTSDNITHGRYVIIVDTSRPRNSQADREAESKRAAAAGMALGSYIFSKRREYNLASPCFCSDRITLQKMLVKVLDEAQERVAALIEKLNSKKKTVTITPTALACLNLLKNTTIVVLPCSHEVKPNRCSDELPEDNGEEWHMGATLQEGTHSIDYSFYRDHYEHASTAGRRSKRTVLGRNPDKCRTSNNLLHQIFIFRSFDMDAMRARLRAKEGQGGDGKQTQLMGGSRRHRGRRKRKTARTRHPLRKRRRSNKYHNNRKTGRTWTRRGRR